MSASPGPIGAALETTGSFYGLIVDGEHVSPPALRVALRGIGPANEDNGRASARKHATEIAADGAGSDNCYFGPGCRVGHAVITEMRRSISRSEL